MRNLVELAEKLQAIRNLGYVRTHRPHDTGIGKTLEDLLGIQENNVSLPDWGDTELKAKRMDSDSMLTLATKSPLPPGVNRRLFDCYKYVDASGTQVLHCTVCGSRLNPQGFRVSCENDRLVLENPQNVLVHWPNSIFDDVLRSKSGSILLAFAETRGARKTPTEEFHYTEAYLLSGLNRDKFINAIKNDSLKIDIRIGVYRTGRNAGRYHDHGTGLRMNKRDFLDLYDQYQQIL